MSGKPNKKWLKTMIAKHGSRKAVREVMGAMGQKGGSKRTDRTRLKGFASSHEHAVECGRKGGSISRRGKVTNI